MLKVIATSLLVLSFAQSSFAGKLEAIDCKQEILAGALSKLAQTTTTSALLSSELSIADLRYADEDSYNEYIVETNTTSRVDNSIVTKQFKVLVKDASDCRISVKMLAD